ncbi:MAG TPA: Asp-tRNA(Asn) amidotransferase subunit GatC [Candidatus Altiarchaeales archaeon]|nr:Asp-tRNA(Asn) amidotransferase subunit GatC [Candidatus Altiarchaeales archaeon]
MDKEKIDEEGMKLLEEFSKMLERVPDTEEMHYVIDLKNITRDDKKSVRKKDFPEKIRRIAPRWDDNYIIAEKGV